MKTALNNSALPTLLSTTLFCLQAHSCSAMVNNVVDNVEQCEQHNIVQVFFHLNPEQGVNVHFLLGSRIFLVNVRFLAFLFVEIERFLTTRSVFSQCKLFEEI